jgi:protein TonB
MFENLVESNPHTGDMARKGSFILATLGLYAIVGLIAFVGGIYWYDAHLENQNLELTTLVAPVPVVAQATPEEKAAPKVEKVTNAPEVAQRTELIARVDMPIAPKEISSTASKIPPVPQGQAVVLSNRNVEATSSGGPVGPVGVGSGGGGTPAPPKVEVPDEPPPAPKPTPPPAPKAPISGGVLNGKATSLPKPAYPAIARAAHASGKVTVQVTIDENGNVISAHAVGGHPLLQAAATAAARGAKFSPTKLSGQPVKVTGVITYDFLPQ